MKKFFYPRLAFDGIRKNKRLYLPYILTQIGMIMMYYIVIFLRYGESLKGTFGEGTVSIVLMLGGWVIAIFACIFLFYTNSFLIRRRKKEFGLYNILGMDKKEYQHPALLGEPDNFCHIALLRSCARRRALEACRTRTRQGDRRH